VQLVAVSETWFKMRHTNRQVHLDGSRVIRADRGGGRRGSDFALYLRESMRYKELIYCHFVAKETFDTVFSLVFDKVTAKQLHFSKLQIMFQWIWIGISF
jgi:hypothetical protein